MLVRLSGLPNVEVNVTYGAMPTRAENGQTHFIQY